MNGRSCPVFWKNCWIKSQVRSSDGNAYMSTRPGIKVVNFKSVEPAGQNTGLETFTMPRRLCSNGDVAKMDLP